MTHFTMCLVMKGRREKCGACQREESFCWHLKFVCKGTNKKLDRNIEGEKKVKIDEIDSELEDSEKDSECIENFKEK